MLCFFVVKPGGDGLRVYLLFLLQAYMVADSYELNMPSCWVAPIYNISVVKGNFNYLQQYLNYFQLTPAIATEIAIM